MIIENFYNSVVEDEKKNKEKWQNNIGAIIFLVLIKLALIYIVMLLWPRVMPKLFPSINKNPGYLNLIGLSVILALI
jgi:hypothetical protein